jgi:hypothetical protein
MWGALSVCRHRQDKGIPKKLSVKKAGELLSLSWNQLRIMTRLLTENCHLKGYLLKLGMVNSSEYECKLTSETASHVVCFCEGLATLRFRHLVRHFVKPGDWRHLYQQDSALCSRCGPARCVNMMAAWSMQYYWSAWVTNVPPPPSCILFCSVDSVIQI